VSAFVPAKEIPASSVQLPVALTAEGNLPVAIVEGADLIVAAVEASKLTALLCAAVGGPYALSNDVLHSNDAVVSQEAAEYTKVKEINVGYLSGTMRIAFDSRDPSGAGHWVHARVYKNGVAFGTERDQNGGWFTYSEDLTFAKGDLVQVYVKNSDVGFPTEIRNFRILGQFPIPTIPTNIL
jgi:hypothetical protein